MWYLYIEKSGYHFVDSGEGPFGSKAAAVAFGMAEVGVHWVVLQKPKARRRRARGVLLQANTTGRY